ncbi:isoaspartyl peptidase/L-asparaginase family protein [Neorhizobium galegae]|uniref:isoaspartyl peptidase/L-asparaginase family protein n=1 Tax=Neorhizobium galegae TaxID=399 RepID=UPI0006226392|nr:isoaspartyl peptidase/L-asparaginase [Neorhizobium galegae]KAB1124790.1 isoaspartyl peptidase/L-asparaginase [Neorhizobium galegae]MCQ1806350.1 isoaspartyl peptidase/L-asparaginase [Neorhizobium galegae]CDZ58255.1 Isoaspartyl peptidase [Neorhizobium galegae bv. orientalis]
MGNIALAIHGGCGVMAKLDLTDEEWAAARVDLGRALKAGWDVLTTGGAALDAVQAAVVVMEDSPHFNAGYGAALNTNGKHELDASIMDGRTLEAGAVTLVRRIRNPIKAARKIMEKGDAILLGGDAADDFAREAGLDMVEPDYFTTERRIKALAAMKAHAAAGTAAKASESEKHGTVGAVALDSAGHLAAATSTGGYNNKPEGRIGDTPIIGAGTYARDGACAVSGTGKGEYFMRYAVGHEVAARISYLGESLEKAAAKVIQEDLKQHDIGAGLVAVGADGSITAPYNTDGMFRGWVTPEGEFYVATHGEVFPVEP